MGTVTGGVTRKPDQTVLVLNGGVVGELMGTHGSMGKPGHNLVSLERTDQSSGAGDSPSLYLSIYTQVSNNQG